MIKAPIGLQDLKRRIYARAKAEPLRCLARRGFGWKKWSSRWLNEARDESVSSLIGPITLGTK